METKMWTLMKKNSFMFVLLSVPLMGLLSFYMLTVRKTLTTNILIFLGQMLMYCILVSVMTSEKLEEKNNGYPFMRHLPIKDRDIVASKFAIVMAATVFLCVYSFFLVSFMEANAYLLPFGRIFLLICGNLSLALAGGMYIAIYRWGYSTFMKISVFTLIVLMVGPFLFMEFVLVRRNIDYGASLQSLNELPWFIWLIGTAIAIAVYWGELHAAAKAKEHQRGR
jgi:hypothetical protein